MIDSDLPLLLDENRIDTIYNKNYKKEIKPF